MRLFDDEGDYLAFEKVLVEGLSKYPGVRLCAFCLMPNHWHLVVWPEPKKDRVLSEWMRWVGTTHVRRWHEHRHSAGTGPIYQGRFKSFPIQAEDHFLTVCRYVERNASRAGLPTPGSLAQEWRWGSLGLRQAKVSKLDEVEAGLRASLVRPSDWSVAPGRGSGGWRAKVNRPLGEEELDAVRLSVQRGRPLGSMRWVQATAARLGLEATLRDRGRPRRAD